MVENLQITKQHEENEYNRKVRKNVKLLIVFRASNLLKASLQGRLTPSSGFRSVLNPLQARILTGVSDSVTQASVIGTHFVRR